MAKEKEWRDVFSDYRESRVPPHYQPEKFAYPYLPEQFTKEETQILEKFFTNIDLPVFCVANLPEEVIGAIFSRYSRSDKSIRRLFLDEFFKNRDLGLANIASYLIEKENLGVQEALARARDFYKRIFAGFGDQSVAQIANIHIAFEGISQVVAQEIADSRIGISFIEKSTRYVDFSKLVNGFPLAVIEPSIYWSEYREMYLEWMQKPFEIIRTHFGSIVDYVREVHPFAEQAFDILDVGVLGGRAAEFRDVSFRAKLEAAYKRATLAAAFDLIRGALPRATVTSLGATLTGQAAENLFEKMTSSPDIETRMVGWMGYREAMKVLPSLVERVGNEKGDETRRYLGRVDGLRQRLTDEANPIGNEPAQPVFGRLVAYDQDADVRIIAGLMTRGRGFGFAYQAALKMGRRRRLEYIKELARMRSNPHLKPPEAFEETFYEFLFVSESGAIRDLFRHRITTRQREFLTGYVIPDEFSDTRFEHLINQLMTLQEETDQLRERIEDNRSPQLKSAANYVRLLSGRELIRFLLNGREAVHLLELRSGDGGHWGYRHPVLDVAGQLVSRDVQSWMNDVLRYMTWKRDVGLGRIRAEVRTERKLSAGELVQAQLALQ